jgi:glycosyltransferase involved in cell wall biosynthesis
VTRSESRLPVRVLVIGPTPPPIHGAAVVTSGIIDLLKGRGFHVVVVDTDPSFGLRVPYHARRIIAHARAVWVILRARDAAFVYVCGAGGFGLWYQVLLVLMSRFNPVPLVYHHHSYNYIDRPRMAMRLIVRIAGAGAFHIVLSDQMGDALRRRYPRARSVRSCSNALVVQSSRPLIPATTDTVVLAHLSNLSLEKGLVDVVRTAELANRGGGNIRLRLAGPLAGEAERALIDRASTQSPGLIEYVGPLPATDVAGFMHAADVFIFPSRYRHEAEPLVVLEAASCGAPTIGRDIGSLASLLPSLGGLVIAIDVDFATDAASRVRALVETSDRADVIQRFETARRGALDAWSAVLDELIVR